MSNRQLTMKLLIATGNLGVETDGARFIAGFIDRVEQGLPVPEEDLKRLAFALEPFISGRQQSSTGKVADFADRIGLTGKQGKELSAQRDARRFERSVADYLRKLDQLKAEGFGERQAQLAAREWYCEREKIADRTARDRIKKHRQGAEEWLKICQLFAEQNEALARKFGGVK